MMRVHRVLRAWVHGIDSAQALKWRRLREHRTRQRGSAKKGTATRCWERSCLRAAFRACLRARMVCQLEATEFVSVPGIAQRVSRTIGGVLPFLLPPFASALSSTTLLSVSDIASRTRGKQRRCYLVFPLHSQMKIVALGLLEGQRLRPWQRITNVCTRHRAHKMPRTT